MFSGTAVNVPVLIENGEGVADNALSTTKTTGPTILPSFVRVPLKTSVPVSRTVLLTGICTSAEKFIRPNAGLSQTAGKLLLTVAAGVLNRNEPVPSFAATKLNVRVVSPIV